MSWIRTMLGPLNVVLDYFIVYPERLTILLMIWAIVYYSGWLQLKRIEAKTKAFMLQKSKSWLQNRPDMSIQELFDTIYPIWAEEFRTWNYWFIPHRWDMWPVRTTRENVTNRLDLSPEWLTRLLVKNGITLQTSNTSGLKESIQPE